MIDDMEPSNRRRNREPAASGERRVLPAPRGHRRRVFVVSCAILRRRRGANEDAAFPPGGRHGASR